MLRNSNCHLGFIFMNIQISKIDIYSSFSNHIKRWFFVSIWTCGSSYTDCCGRLLGDPHTQSMKEFLQKDIYSTLHSTHSSPNTIVGFFLLLLLFLSFLHPQHMEVPRRGVESTLQLPAYTTATATPDPSCICDLHHSSEQHRILNPLSKASHWTSTSWITVGFITSEPQWELPMTAI